MTVWEDVTDAESYFEIDCAAIPESQRQGPTRLYVCVECLFRNFDQATIHAKEGLSIYQGRTQILCLRQGDPMANQDYRIWRLCSELENRLCNLQGAAPTSQHIPLFSLAAFGGSPHSMDELRMWLDLVSKRLWGRERDLSLSWDNEKSTIIRILNAIKLELCQSLSVIQALSSDMLSLHMLWETSRAMLLQRDGSIGRFAKIVEYAEEIIRRLPVYGTIPGSELSEEMSVTTDLGKSPAANVARCPHFSSASGIVLSLMYVANAVCSEITTRLRAIDLLSILNSAGDLWPAHFVAKSMLQGWNASGDDRAADVFEDVKLTFTRATEVKFDRICTVRDERGATSKKPVESPDTYFRRPTSVAEGSVLEKWYLHIFKQMQPRIRRIIAERWIGVAHSNDPIADRPKQLVHILTQRLNAALLHDSTKDCEERFGKRDWALLCQVYTARTSQEEFINGARCMLSGLTALYILTASSPRDESHPRVLRRETRVNVRTLLVPGFFYFCAEGTMFRYNHS